jgi:hypothetical protein
VIGYAVREWTVGDGAIGGLHERLIKRLIERLIGRLVGRLVERQALCATLRRSIGAWAIVPEFGDAVGYAFWPVGAHGVPLLQ